MAYIAVTFNTDEHIKQDFDQVCASAGMNTSAGLNALMRIAIYRQKLFFEDVSYQQRQRDAAYNFISSVNSAEDELTAEDFAEFESGKYKARFAKKDFDL